MGDKTVCLLPALLLLTVPGAHSSSVSVQAAVNGTERASLTVRCSYVSGWKTHRKFWCRGVEWRDCRILVQTNGSEKEVKKGRVSIRDHQKSRIFLVTMEDLRLDDTDTYRCGIKRNGTDLGKQTRVTVLPGSNMTSSTPGQNIFYKSSLLGSVHFLLLVFLKVPLLLSMLSAVLWVNWPQSRPGGRQPQPDYENQPR